MNMKRIWIYGIVLFSIIFIAAAVIFGIFDVDILPSQFYGALIGVVITAIITVFLLQGQTANEEKREKSIKVFEKKQEIYHAFLEELKRIIQDGEITIVSTSNDGSLDKNVDELKDLIFQLGYLQMHISDEGINKVLEEVTKIIQLLEDFSSNEDADKQKELPAHYAHLSEAIFKIVAILKFDLYGDSKSINPDKMRTLLEECGLYVETKEVDKHELQTYFWNELRTQLINKGYHIEPFDLWKEINGFYSPTKKRTAGYGFEFEVYRPKNQEYAMCFRVEIGDSTYYYGFCTEEKEYDIIPNEFTISVIQQLKQLSSLFINNIVWFGYKQSDRYALDFWNMNSPGFNYLKNPRKREKYIKNIANEMDRYIKEFSIIMERLEKN
jgi:hypothetical protein